MRILDRYILKAFLVNYVLALSVLVGMYILFDLIVNVQDFARGATAGVAAPAASAWDIAGDMFDYYLYQFPVIFQQVSGIIPLLAAGFTMVRLTRHHELTAMLASGVSLYRVAAPIILVSMGLAALNVANQEFVISQPVMIEKLLRKHNEVNVVSSKNEPLMFIKDTDGSLLSAQEYYPVRKVPVAVTSPNTFSRPAKSGSFLADGVRKDLVVTVSGFAAKADNGAFQVTDVTDTTVTVADNTLVPEAASADSTLTAGETMVGVFIVYRNETGIPIRHTLADTGHWESTTEAPAGAWVLRKVVTEDDVGHAPDARPLPMSVRSTGSLRPDQIDLILERKAVDYLSSARLAKLAEAALDVNKPVLYKIMHLRFTQPLMNLVLLLVGIPFLLTREPNRLVVNMFYCVAVTGIIFIATFVIFQMAGTQIKDPLLGAWLPVLIFGPFSLVMLDFVKT